MLLQTFSNNISSQKFSHYIPNRGVKHHFLESLRLWSRMRHSAFIYHCSAGTPFPGSVEANPHLYWANTASEGILKDLNFSKLSFYLICIQLLFKWKIGESRVESISVGSDWMLYNAMSEGSIDNGKSQVNDWGFPVPLCLGRLIAEHQEIIFQSSQLISEFISVSCKAACLHFIHVFAYSYSDWFQREFKAAHKDKIH